MITLSKSELKFSVKGLPGSYKSILRVWKDRLHAPINPDDSVVIYMRLDSSDYSVPFSAKNYHYVVPNKKLDALLALGDFIFPIDKEEEIIKILSSLKQVK